MVVNEQNGQDGKWKCQLLLWQTTNWWICQRCKIMDLSIISWAKRLQNYTLQYINKFHCDIVHLSAIDKRSPTQISIQETNWVKCIIALLQSILRYFLLCLKIYCKAFFLFCFKVYQDISCFATKYIATFLTDPMNPQTCVSRESDSFQE